MMNRICASGIGTLLFSAFLSALPFTAQALDRGINYDPAHSAAYLKAQSSNNLSSMTAILNADFAKIKTLGFGIVKTFDSRYSTINGQSSGRIADIACPKDIKLMLGVYEFRNPDNDCADWCLLATAKEVQDAISSANTYPGCVVGIAVGSEDITNWDYTVRHKSMEQRILSDIMTIKNGLQQAIPVGSAQQDGAFLKLAGYNDQLSNDLIAALDFVGANIYPYWDKPYVTESEGHAVFRTRYDAVKAKFTQPIIVTEEGWPSESNQNQNPHASVGAEAAYYSWWQNRAGRDTFSSYYFGMFDKLPSPSDSGADIYFGLCKATGASKILTCPPA
jgi:exo-beta-1,3-glucanase (GH17 family)